MVRVTVPVPGRSYEVTIGRGVLATPATICPSCPAATTAFVVSDRNVADRYQEPLVAALGSRGLASVLLLVPAGEEAKTLQGYESLLRQLAGREAHRDDVVIALGGERWRPRRVRGRHVHAGTGVRPGPHHPPRAGRRRDRRQDRGEPAGGQEPRGGVRPAAGRARGRRHAGHAGGPGLPLGPVGGGEGRAHARSRAPDVPARPRGRGRRSRPRGRRVRGRPVRGREGARRRRGRAGHERSPRPELRAHDRPRAGAAGRVPRPDARGGGRGRDDGRRRARGAPRPRHGSLVSDRGAPPRARDRAHGLDPARGGRPAMSPARTRSTAAASASCSSRTSGPRAVVDDVSDEEIGAVLQEMGATA